MGNNMRRSCPPLSFQQPQAPSRPSFYLTTTTTLLVCSEWQRLWLKAISIFLPSWDIYVLGKSSARLKCDNVCSSFRRIKIDLNFSPASLDNFYQLISAFVPGIIPMGSGRFPYRSAGAKSNLYLENMGIPLAIFKGTGAVAYFETNADRLFIEYYR